MTFYCLIAQMVGHKALAQSEIVNAAKTN